MIEKENNGNANEKILYHGTGEEGFKGVVENGFDDRYWLSGLFGAGCYFANDIFKSLGYTKINSAGEEFILICSVILGNM